MARLDTIRALEKRGLSPQLAEKTVDLGYLLGTLKKADLKTLRKDFHYKEILQLIDVSKNNQIDREEIVAKALEEGDINEGPISADQALRRVEKKLESFGPYLKDIQLMELHRIYPKRSSPFRCGFPN